MTTSTTVLSSILTDGVNVGDIFNELLKNTIVSSLSTSSLSSEIEGSFKPEVKNNFTVHGVSVGEVDTYVNSFDYDVMDYRKVIDITDFEEGSTTGINTLFTIEQTLAQQTYFSYAMGNYGFDLVSWYVLKDWLEMREKLLATKRSYTFDDRTQTMRMYPQPDASGNGVRF